MGPKVKVLPADVGVSVNELVNVAWGVTVNVGEASGVTVGVDVAVTIFVDDGAAVALFVGVLVGTLPFEETKTSCGALAPDSRLAKLSAVLLVVVSPTLSSPFPVTSAVTSTDVQALAATPPDDPTLLPMAGALL